jgi:hypothetical protein
MTIGILKHRLARPGRFEKSGGGGSTTSTTMSYSPEESARRLKVFDEGERIYNATAPAITEAGYPGAKPVPFGEHTNAAMQNLWNYASSQLPQQLQGYNNSLNFSLHDVLYPESNPALQGYMNAAIRPITESYMDPNGVMSQIRTEAGQAGQLGGSRQGIAEGIAAGRYANAVGDTAANVANAGYGQGLTAMGRAQTLAPAYAEMGSMPAQLQGQVGSMFDTQTQQVENYNADSRMWDLNAPWLPLQNFADIVFGGASPRTTTTATGGGGQSTMGKVAGAGATGLATYAMLALNPATAGIAIPVGVAMGALGLF